MSLVFIIPILTFGVSVSSNSAIIQDNIRETHPSDVVNTNTLQPFARKSQRARFVRKQKRFYLDAISDKEDREVVANHIKIALPGVEFNSKPTWVPQGLRAPPLMYHSREADNQRGLHTGCPQEISTCKMRNIMSYFEKALGTHSPGVDHTLRDSLPIELCQLLHQVIVLEQHGPYNQSHTKQINFLFHHHYHAKHHLTTLENLESHIRNVCEEKCLVSLDSHIKLTDR
jgi:hypothetical protein